MNLSSYYIHKSQVERIKDYSILHLGKLISPATLRNKAGTKNSTEIDYVLPSDDLVVVIKEEFLEIEGNPNKYVWYEIILENGTRGWLYSGKAGGNQKIEVVNE